jgi:anti-sigma factor RsiW
MSHTHRHDPENDPRCRQVFELLSEWLDGEVSPELAAEIDAHICSCPPCVQFLESLKRSVRATKEFLSTEDLSALPPPVRLALERAWQNSLQQNR